MGTPKDIVVTIENTGEGELQLSGDPLVLLTGTDAGSFSLLSPPDTAVDPGASTTFTLRFQSDTAGDKSAAAGLTCNDPGEENCSFALVGEVTAAPEPEMDVRVPGGALVADGGSDAFAATVINSTTEATFTIENLGTAALSLTGTPKVAIGGAEAALFTVQLRNSPPRCPPGAAPPSPCASPPPPRERRAPR